MNILIFSWRGPGHPNAGGAEQVTHEHAKAWIDGGHTVTLFTSSYQGASKSEILDGVKIYRYGNQIITVQIFAFLWFVFTKHDNFDLVVDQFHGLPFFTPLFVRAKIVGFIHEVANEVWALNPWKYPFNKIPSVFGPIIEKMIFKFIYRKTSFLTVSASTQKDLEKYGIRHDLIKVINNGVKIIKVKHKLPKEKNNTVMFLGAIAEDKGVYDAVKVFGELSKMDPEWKFWIVGKGSQSEIERLKQVAKELGIYKKIQLFGYVPERKKFELLSRAHVLVNPSIHEGWGLVNIESNSVGTPVVGYKVHGLSDSVLHGQTGLLVQKGDTQQMAFSIMSLVRREKEYQRYQENCIRWSIKFNWKTAGRESLEYIESL